MSLIISKYNVNVSDIYIEESLANISELRFTLHFFQQFNPSQYFCRHQIKKGELDINKILYQEVLYHMGNIATNVEEHIYTDLFEVYYI